MLHNAPKPLKKKLLSKEQAFNWVTRVERKISSLPSEADIRPIMKGLNKKYSIYLYDNDIKGELGDTSNLVCKNFTLFWLFLYFEKTLPRRILEQITLEMLNARPLEGLYRGITALYWFAKRNQLFLLKPTILQNITLDMLTAGPVDEKREDRGTTVLYWVARYKRLHLLSLMVLLSIKLDILEAAFVEGIDQGLTALYWSAANDELYLLNPMILEDVTLDMLNMGPVENKDFTFLSWLANNNQLELLNPRVLKSLPLAMLYAGPERGLILYSFAKHNQLYLLSPTVLQQIALDMLEAEPFEKSIYDTVWQCLVESKHLISESLRHQLLILKKVLSLSQKSVPSKINKDLFENMQSMITLLNNENKAYEKTYADFCLLSNQVDSKKTEIPYASSYQAAITSLTSHASKRIKNVNTDELNKILSELKTLLNQIQSQHTKLHQINRKLKKQKAFTPRTEPPAEERKREPEPSEASWHTRVNDLLQQFSEMPGLYQSIHRLLKNELKLELNTERLDSLYNAYKLVHILRPHIIQLEKKLASVTESKERLALSTEEKQLEREVKSAHVLLASECTALQRKIQRLSNSAKKAPAPKVEDKIVSARAERIAKKEAAKADKRQFAFEQARKRVRIQAEREARARMRAEQERLQRTREEKEKKELKDQAAITTTAAATASLASPSVTATATTATMRSINPEAYLQKALYYFHCVTFAYTDYKELLKSSPDNTENRDILILAMFRNLSRCFVLLQCYMNRSYATRRSDAKLIIDEALLMMKKHGLLAMSKKEENNFILNIQKIIEILPRFLLSPDKPNSHRNFHRDQLNQFKALYGVTPTSHSSDLTDLANLSLFNMLENFHATEVLKLFSGEEAFLALKDNLFPKIEPLMTMALKQLKEGSIELSLSHALMGLFAACGSLAVDAKHVSDIRHINEPLRKFLQFCRIYFKKVENHVVQNEEVEQKLLVEAINLFRLCKNVSVTEMKTSHSSSSSSPISTAATSSAAAASRETKRCSTCSVTTAITSAATAAIIVSTAPKSESKAVAQSGRPTPIIYGESAAVIASDRQIEDIIITRTPGIFAPVASTKADPSAIAATYRRSSSGAIKS